MKKVFLMTVGIAEILLIGGMAAIILGLIPMTAASGFTEVEVGSQIETNVQPGPEETVQEFYTSYLDIFDHQAEDGFHNPLVERTFRQSDLLTEDFKSRVDALLDSFTEDGLGYDPFLCAQDIPDSISAETLSPDSGTAPVQVTSSFEGHQLEVRVIQDGQTWKIDDIVCGVK